MTVRRDGELIVLEGECRVEEAETLAAMLQASQEPPTVDWSACVGLHSALLQALLAFGPTIVGTPQNAFLRELVWPGLQMADRRERV